MTKPPIKPEDILEAALRDQAERDAAREIESKTQELKVAARELGVEEEVFDAAARKLKQQPQEQSKQCRQQRRRRWWIIVVVSAVLTTLLLQYLSHSRPPSPWLEGFEQPEAWHMEHNPETKAKVRFEQEASRGKVAKVDIQQFGPMANGHYHVNLDQTSLINIHDYSTISLDIRSNGLEVARVYLENGDQRWRSPPLQLGPTWQTVQLAIKDFDFQERNGSEWKGVSLVHRRVRGQLQNGSEWKETLWIQPENARISLKFGYFMNPVDAHGTVWVDALQFK